ncbi:hypothetical protein B0H13DRAFT_2345838 [Mycena leptocephala]|nr:hypothetical protein B0H13DRAFT_2345838 [Mycena leptocephala]
MPMPIHGLNDPDDKPDLASAPTQCGVQKPMKRVGVGQDRCTVAMYTDTHLPSSQIGPRMDSKTARRKKETTRKNDSHLLTLLVNFFSSLPIPIRIPFPISPGLPLGPRQSPALICSAPLGPIRLGRPIAAHTAAVVDAGAGGSHVDAGGRGTQARAGVGIDSD